MRYNEFTKKSNAYPMYIMFFTMIASMIISNIIWTNEIKSISIQFMGAFSKYVSTEEMSRCINQIMSGDDDELYQEGVIAVETIGYKHSFLKILHVKTFGQLSIIQIIFSILGSICIVVFIKRKKEFGKQINKLIGSINKESYQQKEFSMVPNEIIDWANEQKDRIQRLEEIREEDRHILISYMEDISHQLKAPLAVTRVICEKVSHRNGEMREEMDKAIAQIDKMTELIGQILMLGKLEYGKIRLNYSWVNPSEIVEIIINDYTFFLQEKNLTVREEKESQELWFCDGFWMKQAIDNIITNAIRHTTSNGEIGIKYGTLEKEYVVSILNEGQGLFEGEERIIFERFSSQNRHGKAGDGLGLAIAKKIIEMHFGSIEATNHYPEGVEIKIRLPKLDVDGIYKR